MKRPLVLLHGYSSVHGRENSVELILNTNSFKPDIIELDIRKSCDGIIFCHHGKIPFGVLFAFFLRFYKFSSIRKHWKIDALVEVLAAIQGAPILFLDFKQGNIRPEEITAILDRFAFREIWLATYSLRYLERLKKALGDRYKYVYNWGFYRFNHSLKRAREIGIFGFHLFCSQCTAEKIEQIKKAGLQFWVFPHGIDRMRFLNLTKTWEALMIPYDDLEQVKAERKYF